MHSRNRTDAFALITVLLLMGFLTALVLGISVLLRVEFQLQENVSDIKKAKSNARIALRMALAELQEKLGPDTYITAPASLSQHSNPSYPQKQGPHTAIFNAQDTSFKDLLGTSNKQQITNHNGKIDGFYHYSIIDLGLSDDVKDSLGILTNPSSGQLKKDLSTYLSTGNGISTNKNGTPIFGDSTINKDDDFIPKWEFIRDFYQLAKSYNAQKSISPQSITPRGFPEYTKKVFYPDFIELDNGWTTPSIHSIGPVIIACSFGFSPEFKKTTKGNFENDVSIKYFITLALWNPYDFALESTDYSFHIKPNGGNNINLDGISSKQFNFKGSIKHRFSSGEVALFSLFSGAGKTDNNHYNLLTTHPSSFGAILQEQVKLSTNQYQEKLRQGGKNQSTLPNASGLKSNPFHKVTWTDGRPMFSLILLSKDETHLYQEIHRLKLDGKRFSKDIESTTIESTAPLFAIIFKNSIGNYGIKDYLKSYNPRAPVACPTKNLNLANPYQLNTFVSGSPNNTTSWELNANDFPASHYHSIFSIPENFQSLAWIRHTNLGSLERHSAFAFGNSFRHLEIPRNSIRPKDEDIIKTHFYDYSYMLNDTLWDNYFLSGKRDYPKEIFEKNFLRLSSANEDILSNMNQCAEGLLLKGAFNVNSTSIPAWTNLLSTIKSLSKTDIQRLAIAMIKSIKERGPFFTLGSFINRRLEDSAFGDCGALQSALNETQINLTQAELLESIGHKLSVRSDSFIIRAQGEASHPFTGEIKAKASCEALVQRLPEYLESDDNLPEDTHENLSSLNQRFGRRFKIISFKWIN